MENKIKFRYSIIVLNIIFTSLLSACVYDPYYDPPSHRHVDFYPYDYYYYPSARVYFHFTTGYYYYLDHNRWVKSRTLLPRIYLDPRDRVRIRVDSDKPFIKYPEHIKKYKPKPAYKVETQRNKREREENRMLYQEYKKMKDKNRDQYDRNKKDRRR